MTRKTYDVGGGNVLADVGVPNASENLLKSQLVFKTDTVIQERGLKQVDPADLFDVKQSDVSKMLRRDFSANSPSNDCCDLQWR